MVYIPEIHLDEALNRLKARSRDMERYWEIMKMADKPEDPDFQRKYDAFYRVRRNEEWRAVYFALMKEYRTKKDIDFGKILRRLYEKTGQVEASFTSKMLATINADMPIWDKNVLETLQFQRAGTTAEQKMKNAVEIYEKICDWYREFRKMEAAKKMLRRFDAEFPAYKEMSTVKKIDFILWAEGA